MLVDGGLGDQTDYRVIGRESEPAGGFVSGSGGPAFHHTPWRHPGGKTAVPGNTSFTGGQSQMGTGFKIRPSLHCGNCS